MVIHKGAGADSPPLEPVGSVYSWIGLIMVSLFLAAVLSPLSSSLAAGSCSLEEISDRFFDLHDYDVAISDLCSCLSAGSLMYSEAESDTVILQMMRIYFGGGDKSADDLKACVCAIFKPEREDPIRAAFAGTKVGTDVDRCISECEKEREPYSVEVVPDYALLRVGQSRTFEFRFFNQSDKLLSGIVPNCRIDHEDLGTFHCSKRVFETRKAGEVKLYVGARDYPELRPGTATIVIQDSVAALETPAGKEDRVAEMLPPGRPGTSTDTDVSQPSLPPVNPVEEDTTSSLKGSSKKWPVVGTLGTVAAASMYVVFNRRAEDANNSPSACDCKLWTSDCDDEACQEWRKWARPERIAGVTAIVAGVVSVYLWYDYLKDGRQPTGSEDGKQIESEPGLGLNLRPDLKGFVLTFRF